MDAERVNLEATVKAGWFLLLKVALSGYFDKSLVLKRVCFDD